MNKLNCCEKCLGLQKVLVCVNLNCECHKMLCSNGGENHRCSAIHCNHCGRCPANLMESVSEYEVGYKTGIKEMYALYHQQTPEWAHAEIEKFEREKKEAYEKGYVIGYKKGKEEGNTIF
jgi:hypothetical protein